MTFLPLSSDAELSAEAVAAGEQYVRDHGAPLGPFERTLLGHVPSFRAYTQLATLSDELVPYIGERAVLLFAHAIATAQHGSVMSERYRRAILDAGDDPDAPQVTESERLLLDWGGLIGVDPASIPDGLRDRLSTAFSPRLRLMLAAFAGMVVACDVVAAVGGIAPDEG
ncbi:hypothetical protein [Homoserinibacter sp. GY 40078]|uniref:hypothetical protein n=1 Tax=Homoserinibacter sp. GY 40078 TaxID=2603275 RepID=UPI0011CAF8C0|nr:hypothetical protein [Homoserinibacter sp. GY 40078]TXK17354.1 hypothetical protein FVQ89_10970 [Homoserinibacter sp. GY 40078]